MASTLTLLRAVDKGNQFHVCQRNSRKEAAAGKNEMIRLEILNYQELTVNNLYENVMKKVELGKYLPNKDQLSNNVPKC